MRRLQFLLLSLAASPPAARNINHSKERPSPHRYPRIQSISHLHNPLHRQTSKQHVSRRNHALRHRLRPRHPRSRPCLRVRTVCLLTPPRSSSYTPSHPPVHRYSILYFLAVSHAIDRCAIQCTLLVPRRPRDMSVLRVAPSPSSFPHPSAVPASSNNLEQLWTSRPLRHSGSAFRVQQAVSSSSQSLLRQADLSGSHSSSMRAAAMRMTHTTRCTTSASVAMTC